MSDRIDIAATIKVNDQASAAIGRVQQSLATMQAAAARASAAMREFGSAQNIGRAFSGLTSSVGRLGSAVGKIARPVAALLGITGGIGMADAIRGMENYVAGVRDIARAAPRLGTTTQRLSEISLAAQRVGISGEEMTSALRIANTMLGRAATGKGTNLTSLLDKMKISMRDANGQLRSSVDLLPEFADAIARQTDPITKQRMAVELFGRSAGPHLLGLLEQGSGGIAAFVAEAHRLGLVITPEKEAEALAYARAQGELRRAWQSLSQVLSAALLPVLQPVIEAFTAIMRDPEIRKAIVEGLTTAFTGLAKAVRGLTPERVEQFIDQAKALFRSLNEGVQYIGGWKVALTAAGLALTGLLGPLVAVGLAVAKVGVVLGAFAIANPIVVAIIALLAALAYGGYMLWKHWEPVKKFFSDLWTDVRAEFDAVVEWLGPWGDLFLPIAIYRNWNEIVAFFAALWPKVKEAFWIAVGWLGEFFGQWTPKLNQAAWDTLKQFFVTLWNAPGEAFDGAVKRLGEFVGKFMPEPIKEAWQSIEGFFRTLWNDVTAIFDRAWNAIRPIVDSIKSAVGWITSNVPSISSVTDKISAAGGWVGRQFGIGGGTPAAAPLGSPVPAGAAPQQSFVQQASAAQPSRRASTARSMSTST
jgi:phage-related minor tail protein